MTAVTAILALVGFCGLLLGLIGLFRPMAVMGMPTRDRAVLMMLLSLNVLAGAALTLPSPQTGPATPEPPTPQPSATMPPAAVPAVTSPVAVPMTPPAPAPSTPEQKPDPVLQTAYTAFERAVYAALTGCDEAVNTLAEQMAAQDPATLTKVRTMAAQARQTCAQTSRAVTDAAIPGAFQADMREDAEYAITLISQAYEKKVTLIDMIVGALGGRHRLDANKFAAARSDADDTLKTGVSTLSRIATERGLSVTPEK